VGEAPKRHLPNADRALVEERKVIEYLLNVDHPEGGSKAKFFIAQGFALRDQSKLRASLIIQGRVNAITRTVETEWGARYTVECRCPTPNGRNPCIRTVWQMEDGAPRLLTAIPL
jgi:hypothetical protein